MDVKLFTWTVGGSMSVPCITAFECKGMVIVDSCQCMSMKMFLSVKRANTEMENI